jgi:epoxyqueuosine reductase
MTPVTADLIKHQAQTLGFHKVGIAAVADWQGTDTGLNQWLAQGYHGDMAWMANPKRQHIEQVMPGVQSVIAVALNYYTDPVQSACAQGDQASHIPTADTRPKAKISRYGWGRDYHRILHQRLKKLSTWLMAQDPQIQARYYADTGPIQDKVWAERAGLGWIAKNSNVITCEYGSWVFLGAVLTNLRLPADRPHLPHCGTCTRCLDACPTDAIVQPFVVDANRCIAYHTIENRAETLPETITPHLQGWVAGCDICQEVCPWNQRFAQETDISDFQPYPGNQNPNLEELAHLSDQDWNQRFTASALRRIKPWMWQRNAQANLKSMQSPSQEIDPLDLSEN